MLVAVARVEILVGISRQVAQSLHLVLDGMGMDNIHDDGHAVAMRLVYQSFNSSGVPKRLLGAKKELT